MQHVCFTLVCFTCRCVCVNPGACRCVLGFFGMCVCLSLYEESFWDSYAFVIYWSEFLLAAQRSEQLFTFVLSPHDTPPPPFSSYWACRTRAEVRKHLHLCANPFHKVHLYIPPNPHLVSPPPWQSYTLFRWRCILFFSYYSLSALLSLWSVPPTGCYWFLAAFCCFLLWTHTVHPMKKVYDLFAVWSKDAAQEERTVKGYYLVFSPALSSSP